MIYKNAWITEVEMKFDNIILEEQLQEDPSGFKVQQLVLQLQFQKFPSVPKVRQLDHRR